MKRNILAISCLLLFTTVTAQVNLNKGDKFKKVTKIEMQTNFEMMGQSMNNENNTTTYDELEVTDVTATEYNLKTTIKRIVLGGSMMGQSLSYDTDDKTVSDEMALRLKSKVGETSSMKVDKTGKITSMEAKDETAATMGLTNMFEGATFPLFIPGGKTIKQLKLNDTWTDSSTSQGITFLNEYKVTDVNADAVTLTVKGKCKMKGPIPFMGGQEATMDMDGIISGKNKFSVATGLLINGSVNMSISGKMEMMGASAPLSVKSQTTTELQKL